MLPPRRDALLAMQGAQHATDGSRMLQEQLVDARYPRRRDLAQRIGVTADHHFALSKPALVSAASEGDTLQRQRLDHGVQRLVLRQRRIARLGAPEHARGAHHQLPPSRSPRSAVRLAAVWQPRLAAVPVPLLAWESHCKAQPIIKAHVTGLAHHGAWQAARRRAAVAWQDSEAHHQRRAKQLVRPLVAVVMQVKEHWQAGTIQSVLGLHRRVGVDDVARAQ